MTATDWSEGYVTDTGYTTGYCPELNPLRAAFALLVEGYTGPPPGPCCELGFGQGVSVVMHAAANPSRAWWGTDFNPGHAAHASELLQASGAEAHLEEQSFAEFCARDDLPQFAFVALHGVWSWVSEQNRALIVDFLRRKLMTGGVAMISYNVLPGWSAMLPVRHLLMQHAQWMSPPGHSEADRTRAALDFAARVVGLAPTLVRDNPSLVARLAQLQQQPVAYLLHEYMNRDWHPQPFAEVAERLAEAKLVHACSARLLDRVVELELDSNHLALLQEIEHPGFRETVHDQMTNRRFRSDLWVRGARRLTRLERLQRVESTRVVLGVDRAEVPSTVGGAYGDVMLQPEPLAIVLDALSAADGALELGELLDQAGARNVEFDSVLSTVSMLVGMGVVHPTQSDSEARAARRATDRLNRHLLQRVAARADIAQLASPLTGGGVMLSPARQGLLAAYDGACTLDEWALKVWDTVQDNGGQVRDEAGAVVADTEAALAVLRPAAEQLHQQVLPALRRLQVVS